MKFIVSGTDQVTGLPIEFTIEAGDLASATAVATEKRVAVAAIRTEPPPTAAPLRATRSRPAAQPVTAQRRPRVAPPVYLLLAMVAAAALGVPRVRLVAGLLIAALPALYVVLPSLRRSIGILLRASPEPPWPVVKLAMLALVGFVLILSSARAISRDRDRAAADQRVSTLMYQATAALSSSDVAKAESFLDEANKVPNAPNLREVAALRQAIANSGDSAWALQAMLDAQEEEFNRFRTGGAPPRAFTFAFPVLTDRAVALARSQLDAAAFQREQIRQAAEAEKERLAAEQRAAAEKEAAQRKRDAERNFDMQGTAASRRLVVPTSNAALTLKFWDVAKEVCLLARTHPDLNRVEIWIEVSKEDLTDKYGNPPKENLPGPNLVLDEIQLSEARKYVDCELYMTGEDAEALLNTLNKNLHGRYPKLFD